MASIISVDNIRATGTSTNAITIDSSNNLGDITMNGEGGTNTLSVRQGVAKAWANYNGTGTPALQDSLNVASITDYGTGDYGINYTSGMSNANYMTSGHGNKALADTGTYVRMLSPITVSTSLFRAISSHTNATKEDFAYVAKAIHGDLA